MTPRRRMLLLSSLIILTPLVSLRGAEPLEVRYRLTQWKTLHFQDMGKAETHFQTVKSLGCEAKKAAHNGHTDVTYRCPQWKVMKTKSDEESHKWEKWLKAVGFETQHSH